MTFYQQIKKSSQYAVVTGAISILSACGGNHSTAANNGANSLNSAGLQIIAPSTHVDDSNVFSDGIPFVIYNKGDSLLTNIQYSFRVNTFNSNISIPSNCNTIPAKSSCNLIIPVVQNMSGSVFSLSATYGAQTSTQKTSLQTSDVNNVVSNLTGIIPLEFNSKSAANGVLLYAPETVIDTDGDSSNDTDVIVTAIVSPQNTSQISALNLVDKNGNLLKFERLSTNTGNVIVPGSVVTFMLSLPGGTMAQDVYVQTTDINGAITVSDSAINIKVISKDSDIGILTQSPSLNKLTVGKSAQVIYVTNNGVGSISNLLINSKDRNLQIINNTCDGKTLNPKEVCSYSVSFDPSLVTASKGEIVASYNNLSGSNANSIYVMYAGVTPKVSVDISMVGRFSTTVQNPSQTQTITIKNNGNTAVNPIKPALANAYFKILPANSNDCFAGNAIAVGESCNFMLNYNSGNAASLSDVLNLGLDFNYNIGQGDTVYHYDEPVYYNTTAIGVIGSQQSSVNFGNIMNDGKTESSVIIKLVNTGTAAANDISFAISGDNPNNIYTYTTNGISDACTSSLNVGASCNILVKFGGATQDASESELISKLNIFYKPQQDKTIANYQIELIGNVIASNSANIILSGISSTFASGNGTNVSPYTVEQGTLSPSLIYTFTNLSKSAQAKNLTFKLANSAWSIAGGSCISRGYLDSNNASCTVALSLDTQTAGNKNIADTDFSMSWVDNASATQIINSTVYAQVLSLANVKSSITGVGYQPASDGSNLVQPQTTYSLNLTLTNSITNSVTVTPKIKVASGNASLSPASCTLSNANKVCNLNLVTANNNLGAGDFSISFSSSPVKSTNDIESLQFHTWSGSLPNSLTSYVSGLTANNNFLYVGYNNGTNNNLRKCSVLKNGNVYSCMDVATINPFVYSFTTQFSGTKAYLGHYASGAWGGVQFEHLSVCDVNQSSGSFENCVTDTNLMNEIGNGSSLHGIAIYKPSSGNQVLYISSFYNLYACVLNSNGSFNYKSCTPQLASNDAVSDIYIHGDFIYFGKYAANTLNRCAIDTATGALSNCTAITPQLLSGSSQVGYQVNSHAGSMLNIGNYFYAIQSYARRDGYGSKLSICPSINTLNSASVCNIQNNGEMYNMVYLNGYMYLGGKKYQIASDGTLINPSNIVGY